MASDLIKAMGGQFGMQPAEFESTVRDTCGCKGATPEQFAAFLMVAREYGLNPLVKEIYAFPAKGGGITPIVSIDGWLRMANDHEHFDGIEHHDHLDPDGNLISITAKLYRKDRSHPTTCTEYLVECRQGTEPWKKWPARMLRHKATIQAIRYGLGFSGISDPDEAERIAPTIRETVEYRPKFDTVVEPVKPVEKAEDRVASARAAIARASTLDRLEKIRDQIIERRREGVFTDAEAIELCDLAEGKIDFLNNKSEESVTP
jgi:phage recombination protein Bet